MNFILYFLFLLSLTIKLNAEEVKKCKWYNKNQRPCIIISKTSNSSNISEKSINKIVINRNQIEKIGAKDLIDVLKYVDGIDIKQNGQRGQSSSLFMRGTNSNHTLVLMNGIPINDQSTTQGLHNFGQDFIQTIQQVEIYKGPNGAHFGPSAIGGAINLITTIDYRNKFTLSGNGKKNRFADLNYTKIINDNFHINFKGSSSNFKTKSARYGGKEKDSTKNYQININTNKWIDDSRKVFSTIYSRKTQSNYDANTSDESGFADDNFIIFQTGLNNLSGNSEKNLTLHFGRYDREYDESGFFSWYKNESIVFKADNSINTNKKISYGYGAEYKYDQASFFNDGNWSQPSVDGYTDNLGLYGNIGTMIFDNSLVSFYIRADNHKTTSLNSTYKIAYKYNLEKLIFSITSSTGLRNPSLYELYGNNGLTNSYKHVPNPNAKPEKSRSNEFNLKYHISDRISLENSFYRTFIKDALLYDDNFNGGTGYTNSTQDLKQDGIENNLNFKLNKHKLNIFNTISSSKKIDGTRQLNRPDSTYGIIYNFEIENYFIGPIDLFLNYKHYGKSFDYAPTIKKIDSTDIIGLTFTKDSNFGILKLSIDNLFNENYQRPQGYSQGNREFGLTWTLKY